MPHPRLAVATTVFLAFSATAASVHAQDAADAPSVREVLDLSRVHDVALSPNGRALAYRVERADWDDDRFDSEIWLQQRGAPTIQLTRTEGGSSLEAAWSPDGARIAFLAERPGDPAPQLYVIRPDGGEAHPLTSVAEGVAAYAWGPYGLQLVVALPEPDAPATSGRKDRYGDWYVEEKNGRTIHLWRLDLRAALRSDGGLRRPTDTAAAARPLAAARGGAGSAPLRRLTGGDSLTVGSFAFGPRSERLAFDHRSSSARDEWDLSVLNVETGALRPLAEGPGADRDPIWSPDGDAVLFTTVGGDTASARSVELARVSSSGGEPDVLTAGFGGEPDAVDWLPGGKGIRFAARERTARRLYRIDPRTGAISAVADSPRVVRSVSYSDDGERVAFVGESRRRLPEVYRTAAAEWSPRAVTSMTGQVQGWPVARQEVISWSDGEGTEVDGLLLHPPDPGPTRRRPLIVRLPGRRPAAHPSLAAQYDTHAYPLTRWLARGAAVLIPDLRAAVGCGALPRDPGRRDSELAPRDEVLSGVDHLIREGLVHGDSLVAVGWGAGGTVAAFLAATTDRFRAVSVGGAVTDLATHYAITGDPSVRRHLGATPRRAPELYARASPVHHVRDAGPPTLVQHGASDERIPIANAYALFRALRDAGTETELVVYGAPGHRIDAPRELLAANRHNARWIGRWLWGEAGGLPRARAGRPSGFSLRPSTPRHILSAPPAWPPCR